LWRIDKFSTNHFNWPDGSTIMKNQMLSNVLLYLKLKLRKKIKWKYARRALLEVDPSLGRLYTEFIEENVRSKEVAKYINLLKIFKDIFKSYLI